MRRSILMEIRDCVEILGGDSSVITNGFPEKTGGEKDKEASELHGMQPCWGRNRRGGDGPKVPSNFWHGTPVYHRASFALEVSKNWTIGCSFSWGRETQRKGAAIWTIFQGEFENLPNGRPAYREYSYMMPGEDGKGEDSGVYVSHECYYTRGKLWNPVAGKPAVFVHSYMDLIQTGSYVNGEMRVINEQPSFTCNRIVTTIGSKLVLERGLGLFNDRTDILREPELEIYPYAL